MAASGPARPRKAAGDAVLVWALLLTSAAGCVHDADRGGVSPVEDQRGDPEVYWQHRDERQEAEPTTPSGPTPAPKTSQE